MHPFDPRDWWGPDAGRGRNPGDPDLDRLLLCGLAIATCLCLASFAPPALVPYLAAELLMLAALGSALEGALRGERPLLEHRLTAWDQAALLAAVALLLRLAFGAPPAEGTAAP